ncbi:hypothetical protein BDN70DRAFT_314918 [Pholiota conissans]|uniref:Uncharacterized protein n=1 Tax=Pholiota conissans TaxID=109636 RepID=A0A9P6CPX8_9AGAR|nr:hypothetical protein BDN70DRAFT_314918 [Pholiota conissans]
MRRTRCWHSLMKGGNSLEEDNRSSFSPRAVISYHHIVELTISIQSNVCCVFLLATPSVTMACCLYLTDSENLSETLTSPTRLELLISTYIVITCCARDDVDGARNEWKCGVCDSMLDDVATSPLLNPSTPQQRLE